MGRRHDLFLPGLLAKFRCFSYKFFEGIPIIDATEALKRLGLS
jgi:hypothetical protein